MKFTYQGPVDSSVTLKVGDKDRDVLLFRGQAVDLPEDHEYVKVLVALGHLVPDATETKSVPVPVGDSDPAGVPETAKKGAK